MILLKFYNIRYELLGVEGTFGKINKVGALAARYYGKRCRGSKPACIPAHYLNNCNSLKGINGGVANNLLHRGSYVLCSRAEAGRMVGNHKVVIYSFRNSDNTHLIIVICGELRELRHGIHRVVTAYVEEISYIVFFENLDKALVGLGLNVGRLHLLPAGAESSCRSLLEYTEVVLIGETLGEIYKIFCQKPLYSVAHTVNGTDDVACFKRTPNNAGERSIYCRGRSA